MGLTGPIRLTAEVKLQIVGAVTDAKHQGMTIDQACRVVMLDTRRLRWIGQRDAEQLTEQNLIDQPPVARVAPHALTLDERSKIIKAADLLSWPMSATAT